MNDASPLLVTRDDGIATLTLNRPGIGNAIDIPMAEALLRAAIECDEDGAVRCVVLTGAGRLFCAGGDVGLFAAAGARMPHLLKALTAPLHMAMARLARMDKPLLTVVNGPAAGAGLSLAVLGDIALAAASAHFTLAYTALGLSPDGGSTWLLPRLIGLRRAQEMALLNRRASAAEAADIGLVTRVVDDAALPAEAEAVARRLAASATAALGRTRNLLVESFGRDLEAQMEAEARSIAAAARGAEAHEGIRAYLKKRNPVFRS